MHRERLLLFIIYHKRFPDLFPLDFLLSGFLFFGFQNIFESCSAGGDLLSSLAFFNSHQFCYEKIERLGESLSATVSIMPALVGKPMGQFV